MSIHNTYILLSTYYLLLLLFENPRTSLLSVALAATPTPTLVQEYRMGGADGGGFDVMDRRLSVYMDVTTPTTSACSGTGGSYDWAYADSYCNVPNATQYLTTQIFTLSYECSTWTQWHTTATSGGKLLAPYGRPLGKNYAVASDKHPAFIGRRDGTSGYSWYYLFGVQYLNGFQCEKSMCKAYFDCPGYEIETTTAGPNFYPLCSCSCVSGYAGQYCGVPLDCSGRGTLTGSGNTAQCTCNVAGTLGAGCQGMPTRTATYTNSDNYNHEFTLYCEANPITYYTAKKRCDLADGTRFLATPRNGLSLPTVKTLVSSDTAWVGLESYYSADDIIYYGGRYKDIVLASGYTNRNVSESVTTSGLTVREMNQAITCYVCEQQTCSAQLDCVEANTRSVNGYYPLCTCVCKTGSGGQRCERTATVTLSLSVRQTQTNTATRTSTLPLTTTPSLEQTLSATLPHTSSHTLPPTPTQSPTTTPSTAATHTQSHTPTPTWSSTKASPTETIPPTRTQSFTDGSLTLSQIPTRTQSSSPTITEASTPTLEPSQTSSLPPTPSSTRDHTSSVSSSITATPTLPHTSTLTAISSRSCPAVRSTIYRAKVSGSTDDLTLLADGVVNDNDIRQGLLVINLAITNNASIDTPSFTFHAVVQKSNITAIDNNGEMLNMTPSCILTTPSLMICTVSKLPDYQVLDEQAIEIRGDGAGVNPPCTDYPWTITWLSTAPADAVQRTGSSTTAVSTLAIAGILLFDGTPIEIQVLTAILNSACASEEDHDLVRIVRYFLSPAMHLGSFWVVIVNVSIAAGFATLHAVVVLCIYLHRRQSKRTLTPEIRAEIMSATSSDLLFPGIPLIISHMLYIGIACATFDILSAGEGPKMGISVIGFIYIFAIPTIDMYLLRKVLVVSCLDYTADLECDPRGRLASWLYPRGVWGPRRDVRRYFGLIGPYRGGYRYLAVAPLALALGTAIIFYAVNDVITCRYAFATTSLLLIIFAFTKTFLMPRRARIISILTGVCLLAVAGVSAINFFVDLVLLNTSNSITDALKYMFLGIAIGTAILRTIISIIIFVAEIVWSRRVNADHDLVVTNGFVLDEKCRQGTSPSGASAPISSGSGGDKRSSIYSLHNKHHLGQSYQSGQDEDDEEGDGPSRTSRRGTSHRMNPHTFGGRGSLLFLSVTELDLESEGGGSNTNHHAVGISPISLNGQQTLGGSDGPAVALRRRYGGTRNQSITAASQSGEMMGFVKVGDGQQRDHDVQAASAFRSRQSISFALDEDGVWVQGKAKEKDEFEWSYRSGGIGSLHLSSSSSMRSPLASTTDAPSMRTLCAVAAAKHNNNKTTNNNKNNVVPRSRGGSSSTSSDSLQAPDFSGTITDTAIFSPLPPANHEKAFSSAKDRNHNNTNPESRQKQNQKDFDFWGDNKR